jgi:hypothetical protein
MSSGWDFFDSSRFSKFWWTKSLLWSTHEVFLLSPKSCTNSWSDSVDQELDLGEVDPRALFIPERASLTGLTDAGHRSDRCRGLVGFALGERPCEFVVVPCCYCYEFGSVWSSVGLFGGFGISWLEPV